LRAGELMVAAHAAYGVTHLAALCRLLPERDPHELVHDTLGEILEHLDDRRLAAALIARFELQMLAEFGFGLDLDRCAATGTTADLVYVSPKSGRAVSRAAGEPWQDRMLRLPAFLRVEQETRAPERDDLNDAFAMTGFFLERNVFEPRGLAMHESRAHFIAAVLREETRAAS